jgi:hypothetical protein
MRMRRARALLRRAEAWVFAPEDPRRLAAIRIGLCGALALRLAIANYGAVAGQPEALFQPVWDMTPFDQMPSPEVATVIQVCGIVAALVAAAGIALRVSLPVAIVCALVLNGMLDSAGRVIVGDALLMLSLIVLLASGRTAAETWSLRRRTRETPPAGQRYGWPIRTMMIAVALAYFLAGFQKWRYSGVPWVTSDNLRWILFASSDSQSHPNELALFIANHPALAHVFAGGALLLETLFPLVLFVPRLRWLFIPGVVAMHIGIRLALGLDYSAQWLTVVIVFVNWPVVVAWLRRATGRLPAPREAPG